MAKFNFEKNLEHQTKAVNATAGVFEDLTTLKPQGLNKEFKNPTFERDWKYRDNILKIQEQHGIQKSADTSSNIIDIMMETGTGKTYTYTKTIFELNRLYGIFKFIIVVPTLPIKAGTVNFLTSQSAREHFKELYGKTLELHVVESKKNKKSKKSYMPPAISSFVNAGSFERDKIQVLVINAGMINSKTMQERFDRTLLDSYATPFDALASLDAFMIVDEPHKFGTSKTTWKNILTNKLEKRKVKDYHNLIYTLSAVDAFNQNLVKGVIGYITEFESGKNAIVKLVNSDGKEATFELIEGRARRSLKLTKKESLEKLHAAMQDLTIENLNKTTVLLSNGLELKKGDKINPYSYASTLQEVMIKKAIKHHFELEREFLTKEVKIKPLTLFFIDNIDEYREKDGYIRKIVEKYIEAEIEELLKSEQDEFYRAYLQKSLEDLSKTHGGYFARDKKESDEVIEKEINEILHDKEAMLDLGNPRRFIFSKWTLREGWDNPNIFQICKLRSSGSEISKLQEVGRGLRLPVNEYGNRVKGKQFYLNYFVDFSESDFVDRLVNEINEKSNAISRERAPEKLHDGMIKQIIQKYGYTDENALFQKLIIEERVIDFSHKFLEGGFEYVKRHFPLIFDGVDSNKIRKATDKKRKVKVRVQQYQELKELWERLNQKVVLEYKIKDEREFRELFVDFLRGDLAFETAELKEKTAKIEIKDDSATAVEEITINDTSTDLPTMNYSDFLKALASNLYINMATLHQAFVESGININKYLTQTTLRVMKQKFNNYLMYKALSKFEISYKQVASSIHPTKLTHDNGEVKEEIDASDIGLFYSDEKVAKNYLLEELYYDSGLEKENIQTQIKDVVVFTKIPKNSIKIPVAGGKSYSPDFAYVLNFEDGGRKLYFVVETKDVNDEDLLREEEKQKIKHAQKLFGESMNIEFKKQFSNKKIKALIEEIYSGVSDEN